MTEKEAITRIDRFLAYLKDIYAPQCDYDEALIRRGDITAFVMARDALKKQRPHGEWEKKPINYDYFYCSKCGYAYKHTFNFCPNCGSDNRMGPAK